MNVSLRPIDDTNREACVALSVTEAQAKLIAPNSKSLAWADANPRCVPLGIYSDGEMVGFAMYELRGNEVCSLHRFMIDIRHQRKGTGLRATQLVLDKISSLGVKTIYLSFRPENVAAKGLYEKLGFDYQEEEPDGELIYRFGPARNIAP